MDKINTDVMYIGNSLSMCVRDILAGRMPIENVERIEAGTMIPNFESLQRMIQEDYFGYRFDKDLTLEVVEYLLFRGKIVQCRLLGDSKVCKEPWTKMLDWKWQDHQESSPGQKEHSDGYTARLNAKLEAQQAMIKAQETLEDMSVVEPA